MGRSAQQTGKSLEEVDWAGAEANLEAAADSLGRLEEWTTRRANRPRLQ